MDRLRNPFASSDEGVSNPNKELTAASSDDFLAFSSTSTPARPNTDDANFKPRRGKSNRRGNWERFGAFNQDQQSPIYKSQRNTWNQEMGFQQNFRSRGTPNNFRGNAHNNFSPRGMPQDFQRNANPPFRGGTPRSEPGPRGGACYQGAPGFFGTPQQNTFNQFHRGGGRYNSNYSTASSGSFRGNRSRGRSNNRNMFSYHSKNEGSWSESGYFHPSMLEDPWENLVKDKSDNITMNKTISTEELSCVKMSDSLIPQVDDTILERNNDITRSDTLEENLDETKESFCDSNYNDSSDEDNVIITIEEASKTDLKGSTKRSDQHLLDTQSIKRLKDSNDAENSMSDSMIPLVGDSILAQDVTTDM